MSHIANSSCPDFGNLFSAAFGDQAKPFAWQRTLAEGNWPDVLIAPTGSGKTAGVTLAWMYRRLREPKSTPRRLVWCLPMRTLVEQTHTEVRRWLEGLDACGIDPRGLLPRAAGVHILMGGVETGRWIEFPESPAVILGTQDMLLSRALMRGFASSRAIWPMEFALLHEDTQWVFDEVQLMGTGRATSTQLEAFRRCESQRSASRGRSVTGPCRSLWISATLDPKWLASVDHPTPTEVVRVDPAAENDDKLQELARAPKNLEAIHCRPESAAVRHQQAYLAQLADRIARDHRTGRMTLVIVNQVKRAQGLYKRIRQILSSRGGPNPEVALLHSRFRPADREREMAKIVGAKAISDIIVIATQAVEAGVDISAAVMFTELAPWPSMVQRFGRANRRAEVEGGARIYWIDLLGAVQCSDSNAERQAAKISLPYEAGDLRESQSLLGELTDVAPVNLPRINAVAPPVRVIRRKDLEDLFDTDSDLTGFDVDISPYVRDTDNTDIRVFWRRFPVSGPKPPEPSAFELCAVPVGQARDWIRNSKKAIGSGFYVRDPQWRHGASAIGIHPPGWAQFRDSPSPGLTILANDQAGGYDETLGFTGGRKHIPPPIVPIKDMLEASKSSAVATVIEGELEGHDDDPRNSAGHPVHLTDHLQHVVHEVSQLCESLGIDFPTKELLIRAARWHDVGKAHEIFQDTMRRGLGEYSVPVGIALAKTEKQNMRHKRAFFRHELASALAFLAHQDWSRDADLIAYLIAAHHGKVRMNLRALPRESARLEPKRPDGRFARGIWDGDKLPPLDLGECERWRGGELTLSVIELGRDETTKESWTERTRALLSRIGPFRLAWLETLLRVADWRASRKETLGEYDDA